MEKIDTSEVKQAPSLFKLGACFFYEMLIVIAITFACDFIFIMLFGDASQGIKHHLLQLSLWIFVGVYFVWCWQKSGQTLAMQTWKLQVLNQDNSLLSREKAVLRYALATLSLMLFGLGFLWAVFDRNRSYLHDKLLNTYIIYVPRNSAS